MGGKPRRWIHAHRDLLSTHNVCGVYSEIGVVSVPLSAFRDMAHTVGPMLCPKCWRRLEARGEGGGA